MCLCPLLPRPGVVGDPGHLGSLPAGPADHAELAGVRGALLHPQPQLRASLQPHDAREPQVPHGGTAML